MQTNFPIIETLDDVLPYIKDTPFINAETKKNGFTVVCYALQDKDTFRGANEDWLKECRGMTFDREGKIAARSLHKFRNVGEDEASQPHNIPWGRVVRVMDKLDGSMITPVLVDGEVVCKTKKSFESTEAKLATAFVHKDVARCNWIETMLSMGLTPTFEWTSPRSPIVLTSYTEDCLTLLHVRDTFTGEYFDLSNSPDFTPEYCPFPIVENVINEFGGVGGVTWEAFIEKQKTLKNIEGWVIQLDNGDMLKVKTDWYFMLHKMVVFIRVRDVVEAICDDKFDDMSAHFALQGRKNSMDGLEFIHANVMSKLEQIRTHCEAVASQIQHLTLAERAVATKNDPLQKFILGIARGVTIKPEFYMSFFRKVYLTSYTLNPLDSIDFSKSDIVISDL